MVVLPENYVFSLMNNEQNFSDQSILYLEISQYIKPDKMITKNVVVHNKVMELF